MKRMVIGAMAGALAISAHAAINVIPKPSFVDEREGFYQMQGSFSDSVRFVQEAQIPAESYRLIVAPAGIYIASSDEAGKFYAMQTLRQLISEDGKVPCVLIDDTPRFKWRGLHFDDCRHFFGKDEHGDFEWTATVININADHNKTLQKNCKPLYHYISYVDRIKQNLARDMEKQDAINEAVDWACAQDLLDGFFRENKAMIAAVSLTEFDQELYDKCRREEGFIEGKETGAKQKAIEDATNAIKLGLSDEQIIAITGLSLEKLSELKTKI